MNHAQRQLVWSGGIIAALLGLAAAKELANRPGANCKDEIGSYVDRRGRSVMFKSRACD